MKQLQIKELRIEEIATEACGDQAELLNSKATQELAAFFRVNSQGKRLPSVVRMDDGDHYVVSGTTIVFAFIVNGKKAVRCRVWELSSEELEYWTGIEKVRYCGDSNKWNETIADCIDAVENDVSEFRRGTPAMAKPRHQNGGRPKTTRVEAREIIADLLGTTPEALRKSEDRAKHRPKRETAESVWQLDGYGFDVPTDVSESAKAIHCHLSASDGLIRKAQTELRKLETSHLNKSVQEKMYENCRKTADGIRSNMPSHLCPYCKSVRGPREACSACFGNGHVPRGVFDGAWSELKEQPVVMFGGQCVGMASLKRVETEDSSGIDGFGSKKREFEEEFIDESEPPREWQNEALVLDDE